MLPDYIAKDITWLSKTGRFPKEKIEISEYDISLSLTSLVSNLLFSIVTALIAVSGNITVCTVGIKQ